jgi:23S rRNA (cytosine1962-C5)-methyltransferase
LTRDALTDVVRGASRHIDRETRIVATTGLGADHPVPPAIPETDYLKTLFCRVLPAD